MVVTPARPSTARGEVGTSVRPRTARGPPGRGAFDYLGEKTSITLSIKDEKYEHSVHREKALGGISLSPRRR